LNLTALAAKFLSAWLILLLTGMIFGPSPGEGAAIAVVVAVISWLGDRLIPFQFQGITRWAIDGGLAGFTIYLAQFLWPGRGIAFFPALVAGFVLGSVEIPLHFLLAARFGLRKRDDEHDGVR
jgi:hypothetical protein